MATNNATTKITLPKEVKEQLQGLDANIEAAKTGVETLKKLNMDVSQLEGQIKWAEEVRSTLLKNFG